MASSSDTVVTPADHELGEKKVNEETQPSKQEGINIAHQKDDEKEEPKSEETSDDKKTELPVVAEAEIIDNNPSPDVPVEVDIKDADISGSETEASTILESTSKAVEQEPSEQPESEVAENLSDKKLAIETSKEISAAEAVNKEVAEEKPPVELIGNLPEKEPVTEAVVQEEKPAVEPVEHLPGEKPEVEPIEKVKEEKPEVEAENVQDVKPADEIVQDEKTAVEAAEISSEKKPAIETVKDIQDVKPADENAQEKKPAVETAENLPEETLAVEMIEDEQDVKPPVENVQEEKPTAEILPEEKPAIETVRNVQDVEPEGENVQVDKPTVEPAQNLPEEEPAVENVQVEIPATGKVENEVKEEKSAKETVENESAKEDSAAIEAVKARAEERTETENVERISSTEAVGQPVENLEVSAPSELGPETTEQPDEVPIVESKAVEKAEIVDEGEDKPKEQRKFVEEVAEKVEAKVQENVEGELEKDEGTKPAESEGSIALEEEKMSAGPEEAAAIQSSPTANEEAQANSEESEVGKLDEDKNRDASSTDVAEGLLKNETVVTEKDAELKEEKNVKTDEESEQENEITEKSIQSENIKAGDVSVPRIVAEVEEKSLEREQSSRDVEVVKQKEENGRENYPSSVESDNDKDAGEKNNESNAAATRAEPTGDVKDSQLDVKSEETEKADTNLDRTKEAVDEMKSDPRTKELSGEGDDTKTSRDLPTKEVISVKPAQKSSGNLISKVKHSFGKVKKAIIGKSPSSKTLQAETKADEKAK